MKKFAVLIVLLVVFSSIVSGFSFADSFSGNVFDFVTGSAVKNNPPKSNLNAPSDSQVVAGKVVKFDWSYSDTDDDEQQQYNLQIDDEFNFFTPFNYYGATETVRNQAIPTGDGKYYWRVRSKDAYDWGEWSDTRYFYLDESEKVCSDGTVFWKCSNDRPFYCDAGRLVEKCKRCGCPANQACSEAGICVSQVCSDGTIYGSCSDDKPIYCRSGALVDACNFCGCAEGLECSGSGNCIKTIIQSDYDLGASESLLMRIANFFKNLMGFS